MVLTPELIDVGRRNFMKAMAGVPPLVAFGAAAMMRGPIKGGPVKAALIGSGAQGKVLLGQCHKEFIDLRAICDINPQMRKEAVEGAIGNGWPQPREYEDWREMLTGEDLEAVLIATPLWTHADITSGCLNAGKHVLCEKMMAYDIEGCRQMMEAAKRNGRVLEIGLNRFYSPNYQAAYDHVIKAGLLGDIYFAKLVYHRNSSWRRDKPLPVPGYDPSKWGYSDWEHLRNWRLYREYSKGLVAELGSHQISMTNKFFGSMPTAVYGTGGIYRYKDGREVNDHVYVTFEYPNDRTATFSSIQSNKVEHYYEQFMGTKGTLILRGESESLLFSEEDEKASTLEVSRRTSNPVLDASESRVADAAGRTVEGANNALSGSAAGERGGDRLIPYRIEIADFCSAIRMGTPLRCGPEQALQTTIACLTANQAIERKSRLEITQV